MINRDRLVDTFLELVQIDSPSGDEAAIGDHLLTVLKRLTQDVYMDAAGNLIARFPGDERASVMLNAHMDTVGTDRGIKPVIRDGVIYSDGTTILGADDKSGVAVILEVMQALQENPDVERPPIEVVFTVGEERGLLGAQALDTSQLQSRRGLVLDSGGPIGTIVIAAPYQDKHWAAITGRAAHAGSEPEKGISAVQVAASAIVSMRLGRIDEETTANVGVIQGGVATNIIPERVELWSEARSRDESKLVAQTEHMMACLREAADRYGAQVEIEVTRIFNGYRHPLDAPLVRWVAEAARALGFEPIYKEAGGGTDANIFNHKGIPSVVLSTGQADVHTKNEHIAIEDMVNCARWVLQAVRSAE